MLVLQLSLQSVLFAAKVNYFGCHSGAAIWSEEGIISRMAMIRKNFWVRKEMLSSHCEGEMSSLNQPCPISQRSNGSSKSNMASKGGRRTHRRQSLKLFSCIAPWRRRKKERKVYTSTTLASFVIFHQVFQSRAFKRETTTPRGVGPLIQFGKVCFDHSRCLVCGSLPG